METKEALKLMVLRDTLIERTVGRLKPILSDILDEINDPEKEKKQHEIISKLTFRPDKKKPELYDIVLQCDPKPGKNRPLRGLYSFDGNSAIQEHIPFDDGDKQG